MRYLLTFIFILFFVNILPGQVFNARVKVEMPLLKPEEKVPLQNFASRVQDFINSNTWNPDGDPANKINTNITIIIQSVYEGGEGYVYISQFLISSESGENFYDKSWDFLYLPDEFWNFPVNNFHPVTSMIDYYVNMVLAGELDTYSEYGGNDSYNYAIGVCQQGMQSGYSKGWSARKEQALEYMREFTRPLRMAKLIFYDALYAMQNNNRAKQLEYGEEMLQHLEQTSRFQGNSRPMERYMEKNARRIAQFFIPAPDRLSYYNRLVAIDSRFKKDYASILGIDE